MKQFKALCERPRLSNVEVTLHVFTQRERNVEATQCAMEEGRQFSFWPAWSESLRYMCP